MHCSHEKYLLWLFMTLSTKSLNKEFDTFTRRLYLIVLSMPQLLFEALSNRKFRAIFFSSLSYYKNRSPTLVAPRSVAPHSYLSKLLVYRRNNGYNYDLLRSTTRIWEPNFEGFVYKWKCAQVTLRGTTIQWDQQKKEIFRIYFSKIPIFWGDFHWMGRCW